jgi:hypothetical protein
MEGERAGAAVFALSYYLADSAPHEMKNTLFKSNWGLGRVLQGRTHIFMGHYVKNRSSTKTKIAHIKNF